MFRIKQFRLVSTLLRGIGVRTLASVSRTQTLVPPPFTRATIFGSIDVVQLPHNRVPYGLLQTVTHELPQDAWEQQAQEDSSVTDNTVFLDSTKRKRKLKMKKHKLRKRRRAARSLLKRLGKVKD